MMCGVKKKVFEASSRNTYLTFLARLFTETNMHSKIASIRLSCSYLR